MTLELVKIQESESVSPIYYILLDGSVIPGGSSGSLQESQDLYQAIVDNPSYIISRQEILQQTNI